MCGIVGYIGNQDALRIVMQGLEKLEYRGYDSAGVAIYENGEIAVTRARGKLRELKKLFKDRPSSQIANIGIGHTRWATHGKPSEENAHPHRAGRISLIHNGIIENYIELREELIEQGCDFTSETDTEIIAQLFNQVVGEEQCTFESMKKVCKRIRGSYAFLALDSKHPDRIFVAKNATPIVVGLSEGEIFIASDIPAILSHTRDVLILEDGDIAEISLEGIKIEADGVEVTRETERITWDPITAQKGGFKHYMLKEVHDQVEVSAETFRSRVELKITKEEINNINRIVLVACGTAWHACLLAKFFIEDVAKIPCEVDYASEYRYRTTLVDENTLVMAVSQSGETADTLAAIQHVSSRAKTMAICNVLGSSLSRVVNDTIYTHAGPEISVASTKAFTTQLIAVYIFALYLAQERGENIEAVYEEPIKALTQLPDYEEIAKQFHGASDFLFIGRGLLYPIALEGALKLKEISYIHAEGYPAGELKHGPLALIDEEMPVVVLLQKDEIPYEKTLSNLREVESRGGRIIVITDSDKTDKLKDVAEKIIKVPFVSNAMSPIIMNIPLQLLSYCIAVRNGTDVDLPRNLAKSVTVE
ncbi:UNVERIFIED_CONTAM: hypothetical protein GTU68_004360 [Idotea baltica]|nr:hypothetical protein [Idotea baltica]